MSLTFHNSVIGVIIGTILLLLLLFNLCSVGDSLPVLGRDAIGGHARGAGEELSSTLLHVE